MSKLILIRHAQASFMKANYDKLSPLGEQQSRILGEYLADKEAIFDRIYIGPLRRHWQTAEGVKAVYQKRGLPWADPIKLDTLDEHKGMEVMAALLPDLITEYEQLKAWAAQATAYPSTARKYQLLMFNYVMKLWANGEVDGSAYGLGPWSHFRAQVNAGMEQILSENESGVTVAAFTSGGTMSAAVAYALQMEAEEKVIELNGIIQNTAMSTFLFSKDRLTLKSFNELPHLEDKLVTYV
ncbi:MAG: histidine phosphatase family protein [Saprospiraceae bacterium]